MVLFALCPSGKQKIILPYEMACNSSMIYRSLIELPENKYIIKKGHLLIRILSQFSNSEYSACPELAVLSVQY